MLTVFLLAVIVVSLYAIYWGMKDLYKQFKNRNKGYRPCGRAFYRRY